MTRDAKIVLGVTAGVLGGAVLAYAAYVAFVTWIVHEAYGPPTRGGLADVCAHVASASRDDGVEVSCQPHGGNAYNAPDSYTNVVVELAHPGTDGGPFARTSYVGSVFEPSDARVDGWTCTNASRSRALVLQVGDAPDPRLRPVFDRMCAALP